MYIYFFSDTYTSEKYMGHPNDSEKYKNYEESDLNKKIESFKGKQFLLISSLADTEVPVEHSMVFVQNLIKENIIFRHQVYYFSNEVKIVFFRDDNEVFQ